MIFKTYLIDLFCGISELTRLSSIATWNWSDESRYPSFFYIFKNLFLFSIENQRFWHRNNLKTFLRFGCENLLKYDNCINQEKWSEKWKKSCELVEVWKGKKQLKLTSFFILKIKDVGIERFRWDLGWKTSQKKFFVD